MLCKMVTSDKERIARMIKLSQNENPFGVSPMALEAIADSYHSVYRYPDNGHEGLRGKLAGKYDVSPDNIVIGAGSVAIVDLAIKTFAGSDENVVTSHGTFVAYNLLAEINRRECRRAKLTDNTFSPDNVISLCDDKTRVMFVANPNNPTGTILSHTALSELLAALPPRIFVVVDEAYAEYVKDESYPDSFELQKRFKNLIILRTFSKIYGLAGLRIGYAIAHPDITRLLGKNRTPFSVNRLAATAASAAIDDTEFAKKCAAINHRERATLCRELKGMGLNAVPSHGNFVFLECSDQKEKESIYKLLEADGIIVRDLGAFGIETGLRISVGRPEENLRLVNSLKTAGF